MIKFKFYFALLIITQLTLTACTTIRQADISARSNDNIPSHDFLKDTQTDNIDANIDPVIKSTRQAIAAHSEDINNPDYVHSPNSSDYKNLWLRLPGMFQLSDINHPRVDKYKTWYLKHKVYFTKVSVRAEPYLYLITEEIEKRNLPGELALLPVIESGFKPRAYSSQKAAGLWQFVPATGRHFGLKQNWWFDGRRDVYQSTNAALTYLEQLNKYYKGDWLLTFAAYNAGAGTVNKAVRKNRKKGKPIDYWSLDLPKETRNYIPKLLAVSELIKNHKQYNISLKPIANSARLTLVDTEAQIDLAIAARMAGISIDDIKKYNPAFKQWATDPQGPHHLLLPVDKAGDFKIALAKMDDKDRVQWYRHKIRAGESLSVIAHKYKISTRALKSTNKLKSSRIRAGKYLMVPIAANHKLAQLPTATVQKNSKQIKATAVSNQFHYTVKKGDSFWKIAHQFKMSHKKLASLNGLSAGDTLSIGQKLIINSPETRIKSNQKSISYQVQSGDSLYVISRRFNVSVNELKNWNNLINKKYLHTGQKLKVYLPQNKQPI